MTRKTFTAQIKDFRDRSVADMLYVSSAAIQDVMEGAMTPQLGVTKGATGFVEGKIPVAEADLINSLTTDGVVGSDSYVTVISNMRLGDSIRFAWTAEYALRMELGFTGTDALGRSYQQEGRHFVGKNAAKFPEFVDNRLKEVGR